MMTVSQLYEKYDIFILHGVTKVGSESNVPIDKTFLDQIKYSISNSKETKLSTFSFAIGSHNIESNLYGMQGIILKGGEVGLISKEDSGRTAIDFIRDPDIRIERDYTDELWSPRNGHNELILRNVDPFGIFFSGLSIESPWSEIYSASIELKLQVYCLENGGLLPIEWSLCPRKAAQIGQCYLRIKDLIK